MIDHGIFPATAARLAQWQTQPKVLGVVLVGSKSHGYADDLYDLEERLVSEGVPPTDGRYHLFLELIHPTRTDERAVHGL